MAQKEPRTIPVTFNVFDTGRTYTGKQRDYILNNIKEVINSPAVRERLRLRQLQGYFGHTMRELAGKLNLTAKNVLNLPNGQQIVADAIPGCVTTDLSIDDDGNVTHVQEVLDNDEGNKIWSLHKNRIGGFSWAASGGTSGGNTLISSLFGFDYVPDPLNANNRGWVMDSNEEVADRNTLLKALKDEGVEKPGTVLDSWYASMTLANNKYQQQIGEIEIMLLDANQEKDALQQVNDALSARVETLETLVTERQQSYEAELQQINDSHASAMAQLQQSVEQQQKAAEESRIAVMAAFGNQSAVSIPTAVLDALAAPVSVESLQPLSDFLQQVAKIHGGTLPLGQQRKAEYVKKRGFGKDDENLGTIGVIPDMAF